MNKKALAVAVAAALAVPMAAHAVKYSLSGHAAQGVYYINAGTVSEVQFGQVGASPSRLSIRGSESMDNGNTVGMHWEVGHGLGYPNIDADGASGGPGIRHMNGWVSGNWGKVTLGQMSSANDGAAFADLGGNSWVALEASCDHATGVAFRDSNGAVVQDVDTAAIPAYTVEGTRIVEGVTTTTTVTVPAVAATYENGVTVGTACPSFDGGRQTGIRYDTPTFGGLVNASFSIHNNDKWALQVKAGGEANGIAYDVRYGYGDNGKADDASGTWVVSGAVKAPTGTSLNVMYGEAEQGAVDDKEGYVIKVAHQLKPSTSVAVIYRSSENSSENKAYCDANNNYRCGSSSWGVGAVHNLGGSGATLALGWQNIELDDVAAGESVEDINLFYLATIFRFN